MKKLKCCIIIISIMFLFYSQADTADVYMDVSKLAKKITIFIPDFIKEGSLSDTDALSRNITDIVRNDLDFSGIFIIKQGTVYQDKDFKDLESLDIDAVLKGTYKEENGKLVIECQVFDITKAQTIMSKRFKAEKKYLRYLVHEVSDEIVYTFTGTKGISHTKITFSAEVKGYKEIFIVDYDGHNIKQLTNDRSINLLPKWSKDGENIIYTSYKRINPDLYIFDLGNFTKKPLSKFQGLNVSGDYSPDDKYVVITLSKDGNPELYLLKSNGNIIRRLTYSKATDTSACWAPNGREITFTSSRAGSPQIYTMDIEGTNLRRLTYKGSYNDSSNWSPRGDKIVYVSRFSGKFDICTMSPDGSNVERLTHDAGSNENPSFSPDGQYIVFTSTRGGKRELYIMKSSGSDQRKLFKEGLDSVLTNDCFTPSWGKY